MNTLNNALIKALQNCDTWIGGALIVKEEDDYSAIPGAYLNDISYTGSREVVYKIASSSDFGEDVDVECQSDINWIINEIILPYLDL